MARKDAKTWETEKFAFPSRLSEIMKERQVSQEKLANALGVKRQTVSLYKTGQSSPNAEQLRKIAEFFEVSTDWLLGRAGSVKAIDVDVRIAAQYTGLSEEATKILHSFAEKGEFTDISKIYDNELIAVMSAMIESEYFHAFLRSITGYVMDGVQSCAQNQDEFEMPPTIERAIWDWAHSHGYEIMLMEDASKIYIQNACDRLKIMADGILSVVKRSENVKSLTYQNVEQHQD